LGGGGRRGKSWIYCGDHSDAVQADVSVDQCTAIYSAGCSGPFLKNTGREIKVEIIGLVFGMFGFIFGMTAFTEVWKFKQEVEKLKLQIAPKVES
jgi:hypothetical protein